MKRRKFHSLYVKWIVLFTGIILLAQLLTLGFAFRYVLPDLRAKLSDNVQRKAAFIIELHENGMTIDDQILTQTGDTDIHFYLFDMDSIPESITIHRNSISLDMLRRASEGEMVISYIGHGIKVPYCLFSLDNRIALLAPNYLNNDLTFFIRAYQRCMISSAVFAALLIVIALIVVIRPIQKVTQATREVAGGNFNVTLAARSVDEVGELIHNFNVMTQTLQKNEYLKKDFVSNVSHEFKTPITSIEGFARLINNPSATREEINEYCEIIIREAARLSNLSSNLLQLSLLDNDGIEPVKSCFLLDEQIREAILILQNRWEEKHIDFNIHMDEIAINSHEELLSRVWINLIGNAIKFSPEGGVVTLDAKRENHQIVVAVSDEGPGVPSGLTERIFDRFYKADSSRSHEGSGLGLSIVKHILTLSGGSITVTQGANHRGACFVVTLPE